MTDWISGAAAAEILGLKRMAVWRSLHDPKRRAEMWGAEGKHWRTRARSPLDPRLVYEVSRARAVELAAGGKPTASGEEPAEPAG